MPDEDGYSFIRRLRALGAGRGGAIPALALTALAGEDDRLRALAAGFQMHITKPVSMHRLTQAVVALSHAALWPTTSTQFPLEK
jgi:CheY-like chemotaxis protein